MKVGIGGQLGFMGMDADGGVDEFVLLGQLNAAVEVTRARSRCRWRRSSRCPPPARARSSCSRSASNCCHLEMGVGVDEHRSLAVAGRWQIGSESSPERSRSSDLSRPSDVSKLCPSDAKLRPLYFSLAPTGTSSKKAASTGFPPSSDAATIMPFDSSPRSLRGARLATITTLRPTSVSGA